MNGVFDVSSEARSWLVRHGKAPSRCEGYWRWVLPDVGEEADRRPEELPGRFFHFLVSREKFPWLFASQEEAMTAAILAIVIGTAARASQ